MGITVLHRCLWGAIISTPCHFPYPWVQRIKESLLNKCEDRQSSLQNGLSCVGNTRGLVSRGQRGEVGSGTWGAAPPSPKVETCSLPDVSQFKLPPS